jgi:hypothetical protein
MKRLLTLLVCCALGVAAYAQTASISLTTAPCNNNGVLTATFTGMPGTYDVTWYTGNQYVVHTGVTGTTDVLTGYGGGYATVIGFGFPQIYVQDTFAGAPPFDYSLVTTNGACPVPGTATVTVTGGAAPFTYEWYNSATSTLVTTGNPANLPGDNGYDLVITDANGCTYGSDASGDSIYIYNIPAFIVNVSSTQANCTNGTATVTSVTGGGTPPYTYLWTNAATTSSISGLTMGYYGVTVTDALGCSQQEGAYVSQAITIGSNVTTSPATCIQSDGGAMAFGSGGMPPYSYSWSNGGTTQSQSGLVSNYYSVTVTDANGCIGSGYAYVSSSTPINVTNSAVPSSCTSPTGSATLSISGGQAPYTVSWNTYPAQTGVTATSLPPGTYSFTVTDANSCVRTGSVVVLPVNIITGSFSAALPTCLAANGSLTINPAGGATPYSFAWSNGGTTQSVSSLAAGGYSVTITDNAGCSITKSRYLESYSPVNVGLATTQSSCIFSADGAITAVPTGGTAPYNYSWSTSGASSSISGLATGYYSVYVTDANGCTDDAFTFLPYNPSGTSCYCTITGTVYNDANANCALDAGEAGIQNIAIHVSGIGIHYTDANGVYSFKVPTGSYVVSENVLAFYPLAACQSNNASVNAVAASGCVQTVNFANVINPIHDIHISSWDYTAPIPGQTYTRSTIISNDGTVTEGNILARSNHDIQVPAPSYLPNGIFLSGSGSSTYFNGGALSLNPAGAQNFLVDYSIPTNIPINTGLVYRDTAVHTSPVSNWLNDYSPWNNVSVSTPVVVSSYDPNFKEVSPKGEGPDGIISTKDSVLEYMIHFQNLGTWQAYDIVVLDTIDSDLDWTTLRPVYQSHSCVTTVDENGVAKFTFNNINLPTQMQSEILSNGMLTYTIKTKKNKPLGTQFTNRAAIYFDYNEPVLTNTTLNTLGSPQNVPGTVETATGSFSIYPNPASRMFYARINAQSATNADLKVFDLSGKLLINKNINLHAGEQNVPVSVTGLTPGIYFVSYAAEGRVSTQKLVIME